MYSVLESDGYRRLFISASAVIFGVMGQSVARGWLAQDLTGSNAGLGGVMLAFGISMLIATPWGGVAADRFPKRTVLMVAVVMLVVSSVADRAGGGGGRDRVLDAARRQRRSRPPHSRCTCRPGSRSSPRSSSRSRSVRR